MTVIIQVPSRNYNPRTLNVATTVPVGTKKLQLTLTRESWPAGDCAVLTTTSPDGTKTWEDKIVGGNIVFQPPIGSPIQQTTSVVVINGDRNASGVQQDLAAGDYDVKIVILQSLRTAVLAERF